MKYFVILSEGEYSDYSPVWFMGEREIKQEELDKKGRCVGDEIIRWFQNLPTRKKEIKYEWDKEGFERYNPETGKTEGGYSLDKKWFKAMELWLKEIGYEEIGATSEINVSYSDIPHN